MCVARRSTMEETSAAEPMKAGLREAFDDSLRFLTLQWKELEGCFDSTRKSLKQQFQEMESKEKQLDSVQRSIDKRFEDLESEEKHLESMRLSIDDRSRELGLAQEFIDKRLGEIELKEKRLDLTRLSIEERSRELNSVLQSTDKNFKELELKERELVSREKLIEERFKELNSKVQKLEEYREELELKRQEFDRVEKLVEDRSRQISLKEKEFKQRCEKLTSKENEFEERSRKLELKEKELEECLIVVEKSIETRIKELKLREKQCEERLKLGEIKEKQFAYVKVKVEQEENVPINSELCNPSPDLQFRVTMDGKCLQIFLNEHLDRHDSMRDEVLSALQMSSNPARVVLDAMQGFYPPYTKNGDKEFEASVIRRSCTLLLGQLLRMSVKIRSNVKEEAMKLAVDWKTKMNILSENLLEVLGFLLLVASFQLVSAFDRDEIFRLFKSVAQDHRYAPALFRALGFDDKHRISELIQSLVKKRMNLAAIRYIYAFELVAEFPPVPILEEYCSYWKKFADEICQTRGYLTKIQIKVARKTITAFMAVIRCIEDHKLQTQYFPEKLEKYIAELKEKANRRCNSSGPSRDGSEQQIEKQATDSPTLNAQLLQQSKSKHPLTESSGGTPDSSASRHELDQESEKNATSPAASTPNAQVQSKNVCLQSNSLKATADASGSWDELEQQLEKNATSPAASTPSAQVQQHNKNECPQTNSVEAIPAVSAFRDELEQQTEQKAIVPAASRPIAQLLMQHKKSKKGKKSENKRQRIESVGATSHGFVGTASNSHKICPPPWLREPLFVDEVAPCLSPHSQVLGLTGLAPVDMHMSSYPRRFFPFKAMDIFREPDYCDGPPLFPGPMDSPWHPGYCEGPLPLGCLRNALDGPKPFAGYDSPPPFHPPFYP